MAMLETSTSPFPDASLDQDDVVYPCKGCGEVRWRFTLDAGIWSKALEIERD